MRRSEKVVTLSEPTELLTGPAPEPKRQVAPPRRRRATGLAGMLLPELQSLAASLHIPGTARMRKGELIAAIQLAQGAGGSERRLRPSRPRKQRRRRSRRSMRNRSADWRPARAERPTSRSTQAGRTRRAQAGSARRGLAPPPPREQPVRTGSPADAGSESAPASRRSRAASNRHGPGRQTAVAAGRLTRVPPRVERRHRHRRRPPGAPGAPGPPGP